MLRRNRDGTGQFACSVIDKARIGHIVSTYGHVVPVGTDVRFDRFAVLLAAQYSLENERNSWAHTVLLGAQVRYDKPVGNDAA
jgi:hypothetical protein